MCRLQRKDSDFLELELQKFVLYWTWMLGVELGPSGKTASTEPSLQPPGNCFLTVLYSEFQSFISVVQKRMPCLVNNHYKT